METVEPYPPLRHSKLREGGTQPPSTRPRVIFERILTILVLECRVGLYGGRRSDARRNAPVDAHDWAMNVHPSAAVSVGRCVSLGTLLEFSNEGFQTRIIKRRFI